MSEPAGQAAQQVSVSPECKLLVSSQEESRNCQPAGKCQAKCCCRDRDLAMTRGE